tara:strand:- start:246 stop:419 length:174 start_codon:yes stop_codon:yes gene_type:complete
MESERKKIEWERLEQRVSLLESISHPPTNWEQKIKSLEDAYNRLYDLIIDKLNNKKG